MLTRKDGSPGTATRTSNAPCAGTVTHRHRPGHGPASRRPAPPPRKQSFAALEVARIGAWNTPNSKAGTGLADHGVTTLCDHQGDLCLSFHHGSSNPSG